MTARRVLVTGSRNWVDKGPIFRALYYQREIAGGAGMIIVHGGATGADAIADSWGRTYYPGSVVVECHPADWNTCGEYCSHPRKLRAATGKPYCPAAGPRRNRLMVDLGADICLAFPFPDSRGTNDCAHKARAAGIPVIECPGHLPFNIEVAV
jgi:hypothetical protein